MAAPRGPRKVLTPPKKPAKAKPRLEYAIPPFDEGYWEWDGASHYEGDRIHPDGIWLCRRRDPHSQSPGTMRTLAEDFERNAPKKFELAIEAFKDFNLEFEGRTPIPKPKLREIVRLIDNEIAVVRRSFERADNHPFRIHLTDDVINMQDYVYNLERKGSKLFFQLEEIRNCAKQDSRAYTVEQLDVIYSTLRYFLQQLIRNIEGNTNTTVKREIE